MDNKQVKISFCILGILAIAVIYIGIYTTLPNNDSTDAKQITSETYSQQVNEQSKTDNGNSENNVMEE